MPKKHVLIKPTDIKSSQPVPTTDWRLCFLCQENKEGQTLVCPANAKTKTSGYEFISRNILAFQEIEFVPMNINLSRLDDGNGIKDTLLSHRGVYHKSCYFKLSSEKLNRAQKRANDQQLGQSPKKTRATLDTSACTSSDDPNCFFCEQPGGEMHRASTMELDYRVRSCATSLRDTKILAKLAMSDMPALGARYHKHCLTALYNRVRQQSQKDDSGSDQNNRLVSAEAIALAELASYITESTLDESISPVFKLSDLAKLYLNRLNQFSNVVQTKINSTHLKERLLGIIPNLQAHPNGRELLLAYNKDIGSALKLSCENSSDSDAMVLAKAAQIVRNELLQTQEPFNGSFTKECQKDSVPYSLLALVNMILEGPSIHQQTNIEGTGNSIGQTISQLLIFNSVKHPRAATGAIRHNVDRETPLPIYIGLMIHASTRKRSLVDKLHDLGLSISYDRVLQLSTNLANNVCALYEEEGLVCPPSLKRNVFTTAAVDNIDHNPSSTTASDSFHGTALSLTNHLSLECQGNERCNIYKDRMSCANEKVADLPTTYSIVPPVSQQNIHHSVPLTGNVSMTYIENNHTSNENKEQWLNRVMELLSKHNLEKDDFISWAAFHANLHAGDIGIKANIAILPLFHENAHSTAMIKHAMIIANRAIQHLNPGQTPVIAMDQPLFSLAKQIQWTWPETLGEQKYVIMLGGLHIEMVILRMLGEWLDGSGWSTALVDADITTSGKAEAILSASHVKRTRYAHRVTAAALHCLRQAAYQRSTDAECCEGSTTYDMWCATKAEQQPQFYYWSIVRTVYATVCSLTAGRRFRSVFRQSPENDALVFCNGPCTLFMVATGAYQRHGKSQRDASTRA